MGNLDVTVVCWDKGLVFKDRTKVLLMQPRGCCSGLFFGLRIERAKQRLSTMCSTNRPLLGYKSRTPPPPLSPKVNNLSPPRGALAPATANLPPSTGCGCEQGSGARPWVQSFRFMVFRFGVRGFGLEFEVWVLGFDAELTAKL